MVPALRVDARLPVTDLYRAGWVLRCQVADTEVGGWVVVDVKGEAGRADPRPVTFGGERGWLGA